MKDARRITHALGGRWWSGGYGSAPCPAHDDRRPSLSLADGQDGRLLARCHAGCDWRAVLGALRGLGLVESKGTSASADGGPLPRPSPREEQKRNATRRAAQAERCWHESRPIPGTPAERYLRGRGVTAALGEVLRFHPACWHGPTARRLPALVALVDGADGFAVHRTYLSPNGDKAPVERAKMMLGATGGGAVRLADEPGPLVVAEGIETALSLALGLLPGPLRLWAALSASGMGALRLPGAPGRLVVAPDGDRAGRGAAHVLAERASREGWAVSLLTPPEGGDFNEAGRTRGAPPSRWATGGCWARARWCSRARTRPPQRPR